MVKSRFKLHFGFFVLTVILAFFANTPVTLAAANYYVDCSLSTNGNGSQGSPWNTLTSVNATTFGAGDQILFKRGTTCVGTLSPRGSGSSGSPIVIDTYNTGNKPHIAANGAANGIYLYNQAHWEIRNLEVSNDSTTASNRRGVYIVVENFGAANYYRINGLTVRNVRGDNVKDGGGSAGIMFEVKGTSTTTYFNDIRIEGNTIRTVDRSGITSWTSQFNNKWTNYIIRNNYVEDTGGDGIVVIGATNALVEYNVLNKANVRSNTVNAGIWAWGSDYTLFQFNEAYNVQTTLDGQGFDIDYNQTGTIFQYNYSHDNQGGFMLICDCGPQGSVPSTNGIVRYNISQNDGARTFQIYGTASGTLVYNNTIYVRSGLTVNVVEGNNGSGVSFYNNIFYVDGLGYFSTSSTFDRNVYYGNFNSLPSDANALTTNPQLVSVNTGGVGLSSVNGYQLQASSPARGNGRVIPNNGGRDYFGNTVPSGSAPDRGAHQSNGQTIATSTPAATSPVTPTPNVSGNRVQNPGFESGTLSPWSAWNDASVSTGSPRSGSYSLRINGSSAAAEQVITGLTPNTSYTLSGWIRRDNTNGEMHIGAKNFGGTASYQSTSSTSYVQVSMTFTTGASNTSATIYCYQPSGTGYGYCDDLALVSSGSSPTSTPVPAATSTPATSPVTPTPNVSGNRVQNPGFESGTLSPWSAWNDASVSTGSPRSGSYSLRINGSSSAAEQVITGLSANTSYTLSGWARRDNAGGQMNIGVKNFGGTEVFQSTSSTSYVQVSMTFTTGSSNTSATIYCYQPTGTGYGYCDDLALVSSGSSPTSTPIPAATSTPLPAPTSTPGSVTNLAQNPGFESGGLSPWWAWNNATVSTVSPRNGSYSLQIIGSPASAEQVVTGLSPNTTYTYSVWVRRDSTNGQMDIGAKSFGGTDVFQSTNSTGYTQLSVTFTTGASNTSVTIYCYQPSGTDSGYCDDIVLSQ